MIRPDGRLAGMSEEAIEDHIARKPLFISADGTITCGDLKCAGMTAFYSKMKRDLHGAPIRKVNRVDAAEFKAAGLKLECESCHSKAPVNARKQTFEFSARTSQQDGLWFEHVGTLRGAIIKAKRYARAAFPRSEYKGCGATVTVRLQLTGECLHQETL